jgi:hypothetical protein
MCYNAITTSYQWLYQHLTLNTLLKCCKNKNTWRGQICYEHVSKFEKPPSNENVGNVGGSNLTPCLIKPLLYVELFFVLKSCVSSMMNCNQESKVTNLNLKLGCWTCGLILTLIQGTYIYKTFHKANKTQAHCEHNKNGLPAINLNVTIMMENETFWWSNVYLFATMSTLS